MGRRVLVYALVILLFSSASMARTWYIAPDGTGDAPTIQAGVDSAVAGDEVVLADGTFTGDGNRDIDYLHKAITVRSESGEPDLCIIDCQGSEAEQHVGFEMNEVGARLEGVKVINGYTLSGGGAVSTHELVTIYNCIFEHNYAAEGGALYVSDGIWTPPSIEISQCMFVENEAWMGSAVSVCYVSTDVSFDHCTFVGNSAGYYPWSGVIDLWSSSDPINSFQMSNCTVVGNNSGLGGVSDSYEVIGRTIVAYNGWSVRSGRLSCCNIYGNEGGDWVGFIADQLGGDGNFSACPSFCDLAAGDLYLCNESPCAPGNHPDSVDCGLIGAWDVGCVCGPSSVQATSWGSIKSLYR